MATCSLAQSTNTYVNIFFTMEFLSHSTTIFSTNKGSMSLNEMVDFLFSLISIYMKVYKKKKKKKESLFLSYVQNYKFNQLDDPPGVVGESISARITL